MMNNTADLGNGSHRVPAYIEWWYFHFVAEDGTAVNMVIHETDTFGRQHSPYISLSFWAPGQKPRYLRRELPDMQISRQAAWLQLGESFLQEDAHCIRFHVPLPGQGHFSGEIIKLAPPLNVAGGILSKDANTGQSSHWVVQVPHATFTAVLHLHEGEMYHLTGTAYQDHQWGSLLLQDFVSDWVWGHFSNEYMAVVFFQILTRHGRIIERFGLVLEQGCFVSTALPVSHLNALMQTPNPERWQRTVEIRTLEVLASLSFAVGPEQLMRCRLGELYKQIEISYLRWAAAATYQAGQKQVPLYGITEYMRIRPLTGA